MKYLLDTCVISEIAKPVPDGEVMDWVRAIPSELLLLSVVTIGEIRKGLTTLPDSKKKQGLMVWLSTLLEDYRARILPIDLAIADNWGLIQGKAEMAGTSMSSIGGLIAATAYTHNLTIVTRNEGDYSAARIPIINPWSKQGDTRSEDEAHPPFRPPFALASPSPVESHSISPGARNPANQEAFLPDPW